MKYHPLYGWMFIFAQYCRAGRKSAAEEAFEIFEAAVADQAVLEAAVADQAVRLGAVSFRDRDAEVRRDGRLLVVGKLRKRLARKTEHVDEVVAKGQPETREHVVVDDVDVEVDVITKEYVVADEVAKALQRRHELCAASRHFVRYPGQRGDERIDAARRLDQRRERVLQRAAAKAQRGKLQDLDVCAEAVGLDVDDGVVVGKDEQAVAFEGAVNHASPRLPNRLARGVTAQ